MWTIRQEQTDAFRQQHLKTFEDEMVEHLQRFSPQHCKVTGEEGVRQVIRMGVENAQKYGFSNRGPVRLYLEMMFLFGSYFDTDPQYPWITRILNDPDMTDQTLRADRLYRDLLAYLDKVFGAEQEYLMQAIRRLSESRLQDYVSPGLVLDDSVLRQISRIYPQKIEHLGEPGARGMIRYGFDIALRLGLASEEGKILTVGMTFAVGHGFHSDPLYAWIGRRLDEQRWPNPSDRVEELYGKSMIYLKHVLAESERA